MTAMERLNHLNAEGMQACNKGRMDEAFSLLLQADRIAHEVQAPLNQARVRNNIGLLHQVDGNGEEALACFRLAHHTAAGCGGETGEKLAKIIHRNLNRLETALGAKAA